MSVKARKLQRRARTALYWAMPWVHTLDYPGVRIYATAMAIRQKVERFLRKNRREKVASILRKCRIVVNDIRQRAEDFKFERLITGPLAPPQVLCSRSQLYVAYRPDSDLGFSAHPELQSPANKWVANNVRNNAGDLPRFYALALNIKQVIADGIAGDFAELGVYRGNSAAILAHYARDNHRSLFLFDTFEGFEAKR